MGFLVWLSFIVLAVVGWQMLWQGLEQKIPSPWSHLPWTERRIALAKLAFSGVENLILIVVFFFLAFKVNAAFFVLLGAVLWLFVRQVWTTSFFGLAICLLMLERAFQMSSLVFAESLHQPWLFALGERGFSTLLMVFIAGFILGCALPWLWFHLILSFMSYSIGLSSLAATLVFLAAGVIGFRLQAVLRRKNQKNLAEWIYRFLISCVSLPVALVVAGLTVRPQELAERSGVYLVTAAGLLLVELGLSAAVFHFYSARQERRINANG